MVDVTNMQNVQILLVQEHVNVTQDSLVLDLNVQVSYSDITYI